MAPCEQKNSIINPEGIEVLVNPLNQKDVEQGPKDSSSFRMTHAQQTLYEGMACVPHSQPSSPSQEAKNHKQQ